MSALYIDHNRHIHIGVQRSVHNYYKGLQPFHHRYVVISDERQMQEIKRIHNRERRKCAGKSHNTNSVPEFASIFILSFKHSEDCQTIMKDSQSGFCSKNADK